MVLYVNVLCEHCDRQRRHRHADDESNERRQQFKHEPFVFRILPACYLSFNASLFFLRLERVIRQVIAQSNGKTCISVLIRIEGTKEKSDKNLL